MRAEPESHHGTNEPVDTAVVLETPEHVRFSHLLAGPARRALAYGIDTALRFVVLGLAGALAVASGGLDEGAIDGMAEGFLFLLAFLLEWGYFVLFETLWDGQSPGKRALHLRVVNAAGRPLGFVDSVLRNILRAADFLPFGYALGFVVVAFDPRFRRLGDFVAGTLVIAEDPRRVEAEIPRLPRPTAEELGAVPEHVLLLPGEVEVVELYLRRRRVLSHARAEELAELAARAIARRAGVPGRYRSASRFLEILYFRALGGTRGLA